MSADAAALACHLRDSAQRYFPGLTVGSPAVRLLSTQRHTTSALLLFAIGDRRAVVKVRGTASPHREADWARLVPAPTGDKGRLEHLAMRALQDHFEGLADVRFGAVRVLDFLPEWNALVMEAAEGRRLSQLLARARRPRPLPDLAPLEAALRNVGSWLRELHRLPPPAHAVAHASTREALLISIRELCDFLASTSADADFFRQVVERAEQRAVACLPEALASPPAHGDFWPGNLLVGPGSRVTALDTMLAWRGPAFHDISYFLWALKVPNAQAYSQGLLFGPGLLARLESHFLAGYFGEAAIPYEPIRLYEVQLALHDWARAAHAAQEFPGLQQIAKGWRLLLKRRFFRRHVEGLLSSPGPPGRSAAVAS